MMGVLKMLTMKVTRENLKVERLAGFWREDGEVEHND